MRTLTYLAMFLIASATCRSELPETSVAALLAQSDAVIVGELRHHGGVCATGGIYAAQHFDVLTVLAGTVTGSSVSVGFQWKPGEQAIPLKIGEKMVLFLKAPSVPVRGCWYLRDVHTGAQPYSQALETTIRNLVAQRHEDLTSRCSGHRPSCTSRLYIVLVVPPDYAHPQGRG